MPRTLKRKIDSQWLCQYNNYFSLHSEMAIQIETRLNFKEQNYKIYVRTVKNRSYEEQKRNKSYHNLSEDDKRREIKEYVKDKFGLEI